MKTNSFLCLLSSVILLASACSSKKEDPTPTTPSGGFPVTAIITVTPDGGSSYPLTNGRITFSQWGGPITRLDLNGLLADGRSLTVKFNNGGTTPYLSTNLTASVNGTAAIVATGQLEHAPNAATASGTFRLEFADGLRLNGTLVNIPAPL
jgi:hypothetical protein